MTDGLNINPALLPKYPGFDTHARVLMAGDREHGVSVYYVTETVDEGPIICHAKLLVSKFFRGDGIRPPNPEKGTRSC